MSEQSADIAHDDAAPAAHARGPEVIKQFARTLPGKPGVYRMYDAKGNVLYVGKARNLKARVSNYTRLGGHTNRIAAMIANTVSMEFVTTRTEPEALLLEANLIKRLKPRYNVILRDDKSFPYILIAKDHEAAQITKHRGARSRKGSYYGPFASAGSVNATINSLQKAFLLRSCTDSYYDNRTRPCLLFQIKRCSAPCTAEISPEDYNELVKQAEAFLSGKSDAVKKQLARQMEAAAEDLDFERAAIYRDRISALSHVTASQGINPAGIEEADIFGIAQQGGQTCIQVFFIRAGQNWGARAYFPRADRSVEPADVLAAFIAQFYDDKPVPRQLLLSDEAAEAELLADALSSKAGRKVEITVPQRGGKRELVDHARTNAREALGRRLAETSSQRKLLEGVQTVFGLDSMPRRIEVYDNSHIQGANAVGAMIVAGPEGFAKAHYRKFNIQTQMEGGGDDFAMMREVLTRRFSRLVREHGARPDQPADADAGGEDDDDTSVGTWPDLLLIDGGKGQLSAVLDVLRELGVEDVAVAGISKGPDRDAGREQFHVAGKAPFMLEQRDPVLYYVQRLRDEAHRFAIGTHRAKRSKAIVANPLDEIEGIGPGRKKALLRAFGSARAVSRASVADLEAVEGISRSLATSIYEHFHEGGQ
ncbi:MAG: excinuclease ABC subunit UvrC [Anderseniella sp.]|jgi:excinuclease ABC subunit C|nr:excinuclease ABC subunit UvrC [Anderseniella sp.]